MRVDWTRTITAVAVIFAIAALVAAFHQTSAAKSARAEAVLLEELRKDAAALARRLAVEAREARELAEYEIRRADERRARAERRASALEASAAAFRDRASETGLEALRIVRALDPESDETETLASVIEQHLHADSVLVQNYEDRLDQAADIIGALEDRSAAFEMRAITAERALEASQVECQACQQEAEAWRRAANPGWFERFRRSLPSMGLTVLGTAVLFLAI